MKLVCDCGNEGKFNTTDEKTGEEYAFTQGEGQYSTIDNFRFWQSYNEVGIVCEKCGKPIWFFT